jgi:hypothetical protein
VAMGSGKVIIVLLQQRHITEYFRAFCSTLSPLFCSVGSWGGALLVWAISGLAAMFGALSWAELSAAHPRYFIAVRSGGHVWSALLG